MPPFDGKFLVETETTKFDDWLLELDPYLIGAKARNKRAFNRSYCRCFVFSLHDLEGYKKNPSTFNWRTTILFFKFSVSEKICVHAHCQKLLTTRLIEFSNGKYACAIIMPLKNDIFGNWMEKQMCGDYRLVNRKIKSEWYSMPIP